MDFIIKFWLECITLYLIYLTHLPTSITKLHTRLEKFLWRTDWLSFIQAKHFWAALVLLTEDMLSTMLGPRYAHNRNNWILVKKKHNWTTSTNQLIIRETEEGAYINLPLARCTSGSEAEPSDTHQHSTCFHLPNPPHFHTRPMRPASRLGV